MNFRIIILLLFLPCLIQAQKYCGTAVTQEDIYALEEFYDWSRSQSFKKVDTNIYSIPVKIHIIRNSDGTGGIAEGIVQNAFDSAQYFMKKANIRLEMCHQINYIDDDQFTIFESDFEEERLTKNSAPRMINIYFADSVLIENTVVCGYAYTPYGPTNIFITNFCANRGNTLAHELGHTFSLLHTHGISNVHETDEFVNGNNCHMAGDLICDTPADPNLDGNIIYDSEENECTYFGFARDAAGDLFQPLTNNIMSYTHPNCSESMTSGQYKRMYFSLFYFDRIELICTPEDETVSSNKINGVYPNPFDYELNIFYQLEKSATVEVALYDMLGRKVEQIFSGQQEAGLVRIHHSFGDTYIGPSIYLLKVEINGSETLIQRIMKRF